MKWVSLLSFAFAFTTTPVFAQALYRMPLNNAAECPVGLVVTHGAGLPVAMAAGPAVPPAQAQGIHLTLTNPGAQEIAGMQITVHGFSGKWRATPAAGDAGSDVSRTMQLDLHVKHNGQAVRDLSLSHFTAITRVDVNAIEYADGSRWKAPSAGACSVFPDPVMLVAAR